jgi:hypothetical protein
LTRALAFFQAWEKRKLLELFDEKKFKINQPNNSTYLSFNSKNPPKKNYFQA